MESSETPHTGGGLGVSTAAAGASCFKKQNTRHFSGSGVGFRFGELGRRVT